MNLSLTRRTVTTLLSASALTVPALAKKDVPAAGADARFEKLGKKWLEASLRLSPTGATQTGDHRFDGEMDDLSTEGRALQIKTWKALLAELNAIDRSKLTRDNQVDAALLSRELRRNIWDDEVLQSWAWNPQYYSSLAGGSLYALMSREFAPLPARLSATISRMEKIPKLLAQMRAGLDVARVPQVFATTVAKQNAGTMDIVNSFVLPQAGGLSAAEQARLKAAADALKTACDEHQAWLDKTLVPGAKGDFRIGAKLFDEKLAFTLDTKLSRKEIRERAEAAIAKTRGDMYGIARTVLAGRADAPALPDAPTPEQQQAGIEAALALAYAQKPPRDKVVEACTTGLHNATDFVRAHDLITLPDAPVEVVVMPKFAQGVAVAYCDSPGPLDKGMKTFFDVSPIPDDWTPEQSDSFLREYNSLGIVDIAVHEAMPGHYVQLWHSNKCPSILRAVMGSGSFIEGWAVYAEGMMVEQGFMKEEPLYRLVQLKVLLRTISNSILDQAIHVDGISKDDAMTLMTKTAFQQEREAAGKWIRASLSSTQLSTYFVGVSEHNEMRAEAQRRAGASFNLKTYHDAVLSHGSPPAHYVRALMFDEAIG